jgi:hypothetical protein
LEHHVVIRRSRLEEKHPQQAKVTENPGVFAGYDGPVGRRLQWLCAWAQKAQPERAVAEPKKGERSGARMNGWTSGGTCMGGRLS